MLSDAIDILNYFCELSVCCVWENNKTEKKMNLKSLEVTILFNYKLLQCSIVYQSRKSLQDGIHLAFTNLDLDASCCCWQNK